LPDESLTDEAYVPRILREWSVDGLLINYIAGIPDKMIELIQRYQIPSSGSMPNWKAIAFIPDDFEAAQRACKYLQGMGHRRIRLCRLHGFQPLQREQIVATVICARCVRRD
jgi:DNA-binding LacI/PurR family transcriptional regulator